MKIEPLPCPWCGAIPTVGPPDESTAGDCFGYVTCENPECSVNPESEDRREVNGNEGREHYRQMAVANWNRRMNVNVDLPDTAAQDSASKSNNPAVSG